MVGTSTKSRGAYSLTDVTPARTIWVYRNGDAFYLGRKFVINHRYVPNFEAFMIQLNEGVPTSFGVRKIYTPHHGHSVTDLSALQQGGRYVAAGREKFRKLNYLNIGAKRPQRKKRDEVIRPVVHSNIQVPSKFQSFYNKPRSINVFTNGDMLIPPVKILIPRFTLQNWNGVLGLVNEKVFPRYGGIHRLYTLNGQIVHGSDDLEDNHFYVACGKDKFQQLPYWQHPKVPGDIQRDPNSPGPPEKHPPKKPPIGVSVQLPIQPSKRGAGDRASVYYAKSEKASREMASTPLSPDHAHSVYKAQRSPKEIEGAKEIQEDKDLQVEIPVDQAPAEDVHEEDIYSNVGSLKEAPAENVHEEDIYSNVGSLKEAPAENVHEEDIYSNVGSLKEPEKEDNKDEMQGEREGRKESKVGEEEEEEEEEEKEEQLKQPLERKDIFNKMFGFLFNKPKTKDGMKEDMKHQDANKHRRSNSAAENEFFDANDYD